MALKISKRKGSRCRGWLNGMIFPAHPNCGMACMNMAGIMVAKYFRDIIRNRVSGQATTGNQKLFRFPQLPDILVGSELSSTILAAFLRANGGTAVQRQTHICLGKIGGHRWSHQIAHRTILPSACSF